MTARVVRMFYTVNYPNEHNCVAEHAEPVTTQINGFRLTVTARMLTAEPDDEYADVDAARSVLEPALRAWEAKSELIDRVRISFDYSYPKMEYTQPEDGTVTGAVRATLGVASLTAVATVEHGMFPTPDARLTQEGMLAVQLRDRWRQMEQGKETLTGAAYFILTRVRHAPFVGNPKQAAGALKITQPVLNKLGKLSSRSDPEHGRKVGQTDYPLTDAELAWLRAVLPVLIYRVLEYETGASGLAQITVDQLPPLP